MTESEQRPGSTREGDIEWVEHDGVLYRSGPREGETQVVEGAPDPVTKAQPKAAPAPEGHDVEWDEDRFGEIYPPAGGAMTGTVLPPAEPDEV